MPGSFFCAESGDPLTASACGEHTTKWPCRVILRPISEPRLGAVSNSLRVDDIGCLYHAEFLSLAVADMWRTSVVGPSLPTWALHKVGWLVLLHHKFRFALRGKRRMQHWHR
jgi:hypothetical protein